ncbi:MAG: NUDIX domain-containing protein [Candidatus Omnitrophica bacterium]|nr:NUDIX domain-containing protein [Candidatus Omnitrophota bacterium]
MKKTKSAGGIVVNAKGEILIVNQGGLSWSLPKGHLEKGEGPLDAARREIEEEAGLKRLRWLKDLGRYTRYKIGLQGGEDRRERKEIFMFLFKTDQIRLRPLDPKHPEARWVKKEEVAGLLTHPRDKQFFLEAMGNDRMG